jgi:hypothetical protein
MFIFEIDMVSKHIGIISLMWHDGQWFLVVGWGFTIMTYQLVFDIFPHIIAYFVLWGCEGDLSIFLILSCTNWFHVF